MTDWVSRLTMIFTLKFRCQRSGGISPRNCNVGGSFQSRDISQKRGIPITTCRDDGILSYALGARKRFFKRGNGRSISSRCGRENGVDSGNGLLSCGWKYGGGHCFTGSGCFSFADLSAVNTDMNAGTSAPLRLVRFKSVWSVVNWDSVNVMVKVFIVCLRELVKLRASPVLFLRCQRMGVSAWPLHLEASQRWCRC